MKKNTIIQLFSDRKNNNPSSGISDFLSYKIKKDIDKKESQSSKDDFLNEIKNECKKFAMNDSNLIDDGNETFDKNSLIDDEITATRKVISALEKQRGTIPVYILIPVIVLCWGFAYAKITDLMLSVPLFALSLVLIRTAQKNYDKVWCINQQIKKEKKKLE